MYTTSDASGIYTFAFVPVGVRFPLEFFDPRTGRIGLGGGVVDYDTEVVTIDLQLLPQGTVKGTVTRRAGSAVPGAQVELSSGQLMLPEGLSHDASFFGPGKLTTTTNLDGSYAIGGVPQGDCTVQATDRVTGAMGSGAEGPCYIRGEDHGGRHAAGARQCDRDGVSGRRRDAGGVRAGAAAGREHQSDPGE
jgi:hypothetical protein